MASKWEQRGQELVSKLRGLTDETRIKELAGAVVDEIRAHYPEINSRRAPLATIRKAVSTAFPETKTQKHDYQYFSNSGKGKIPRYQHLALKFLTLSQEEWNSVADDARKEFLKNSAPTEPETTKSIFTLNDLTIQTLEFDPETQAIVEASLANSGLSLPDFIKQAVKVYAKTIEGKSKQHTSDLSMVPTAELLKNPKYKTHPVRARESVKRAIQAIKIFNTNEPEPKNRWMITQTAIQSLTGSKPATVKEILADYQRDIDDYNQAHGLDSPYLNRKAGQRIEEVIDVALLVPDGID